MMRYLICILLLLPSAVFAADYTADSCSYADVSNKFADSTIDGDTLNIPAGSCDWSGSTLYSGTGTKGVKFSGAGTNESTGTKIWNGRIRMNVDSGYTPVEVTGLIMRGTGTKVCLYGTQNGFRVHHNLFETSSNNYTIDIGDDLCTNDGQDYTVGLIDNNRIVNTGSLSAIIILADGPTNAYARTSKLGTQNINVIEDNYIERSTGWTGQAHGIWSQDGGSFAARSNTIVNYDLDIHGNCSWFGSREFEWYENELICESGANCVNMLIIRGGTGVVWNNTVTDEGSSSMDFDFYDDRLQGTCTAAVYANKTAQCNDSSLDNDGTYPMEYGFGRGYNNTLDPIYMWGNSYEGNSVTWATISPLNGTACDADTDPDITLTDSLDGDDYLLLKEDRDVYFQTAKPGYTPLQYPHPLIQSQDGVACEQWCGDRSVFKGGSFKGGSMK